MPAGRAQKPAKQHKQPKPVAVRQAGQPWTVPELAAELRVSDQYLYNRIRAEKIEVLKLDGVFRIPDRVAQQMMGNG